jgi:hypothetical protein
MRPAEASDKMDFTHPYLSGSVLIRKMALLIGLLDQLILDYIDASARFRKNGYTNTKVCKFSAGGSILGRTVSSLATSHGVLRTTFGCVDGINLSIFVMQDAQTVPSYVSADFLNIGRIVCVSVL